MQDRSVDDILEFGKLILVACGGLSLAIGVRMVAGRLAIPTAGLLLVAAAAASEVFDFPDREERHEQLFLKQ